jgi:hypothetical protein
MSAPANKKIYVDLSGNDSTGDGSILLPLLTIGAAVALASDAAWATNPVVIEIGPGTFVETFFIPDGIILRGSGRYATFLGGDFNIVASAHVMISQLSSAGPPLVYGCWLFAENCNVSGFYVGYAGTCHAVGCWGGLSIVQDTSQLFVLASSMPMGGITITGTATVTVDPTSVPALGNRHVDPTATLAILGVATLTAGANITVDHPAGDVTISATGGGGGAYVPGTNANWAFPVPANAAAALDRVAQRLRPIEGRTLL